MNLYSDPIKILLLQLLILRCCSHFRSLPHAAASPRHKVPLDILWNSSPRTMNLPQAICFIVHNSLLICFEGCSWEGDYRWLNETQNCILAL